MSTLNVRLELKTSRSRPDFHNNDLFQGNDLFLLSYRIFFNLYLSDFSLWLDSGCALLKHTDYNKRYLFFMVPCSYVHLIINFDHLVPPLHDYYFLLGTNKQFCREAFKNHINILPLVIILPLDLASIEDSYLHHS